MVPENSKLIKYLSYTVFIILIIAIIPMALLGLYNHALGDDFYYGYASKLALDNGNIFNAIAVAAKGVVLQYNRWQGTYSAMFFMYLPPQIFGDIFYKLYPTVLLICLVAGFFYMLKPLICTCLQQSQERFILITSLIVLLILEQSPVLGEAFYWYNGSMYYTGFYALTLFFFGGIFRFIKSGKTYHIVLLSICGLFLAGGNYASLLPAILILFTILALLLWKKKSKKTVTGLGIIMVSILAGFAVSVLAPGNAARQTTSYGTTPIKAILKSLLQGATFIKGWSNVWIFLILIALTPLFIMIIRDSSFSFKYPLIVLILAFGIFSSASCPTFYAQNNGGAARVFVLSWYNMVLLLFGCYFYLLGWYIKKFDKKALLAGEIAIAIVFIVLVFIRPISETYIQLNSVHAITSISNGDAKYYEAQYCARTRKLNSDEKDVIFEAYDVPDSLKYVLYLGDMSDDTADVMNEAFAKFYNKNSVVVK